MTGSKTAAGDITDSQRAAENSMGFGVNADQLIAIVDAYKSRTYIEDIDEIEKLGGVESLLSHLQTNLDTGINGPSDKARDAYFGANAKEKKPRTTFCELLIAALDDFMLKLLLVCAAFSLVTELVFYPDHRATGWIDGTCIFLAVAVVSVFTAVSDYNKETEFIKQQALAESTKTVSSVTSAFFEIGQILECLFHFQ